MYDIEKDVENVAKAIRDEFREDFELEYVCIEQAKAALNASDAVKQLKELQDRYNAQGSLLGSTLELNQTLIKRLKELEAMNEWQPIITHPTDEIFFLAFWEKRRECAVIAWIDDEFRDKERTQYHCPDYWKPLTPPKQKD